MKIKAVCDRTGLTDRTIRYYIEEDLISPSFTENYFGRKSFDFTEDNISELNDIAVLRSFDFSIEEIRQILRDPGSSLAIIKAVKERVNGELITSREKIAVLASLSEGTAYTVCELARELSKPPQVARSEERIEARPWQRIKTISREVLFFLAAWLPPISGVGAFAVLYASFRNPIVSGVFLPLTLLTFLPSLIWILASRSRFLQKRIVRTILLSLCLVCIPLSVLAAFGSVEECEHSWQLTARIEPKCDAEGELVKSCDICREITREVLGRIPHTVVTDHAVKPTCTATGLTEGSHCSACGVVMAEQKTVPMTEHAYSPVFVEPTCGQDGSVTFVCSCGDSYRAQTLFANEKHEFIKSGDKGYQCRMCGLRVCEFGSVGGEKYGGNSDVTYYITGAADEVPERGRTLVICGMGEMPVPPYGDPFPYRESVYVQEITTVIICDRITSIAEGAFEGAKSDDGFGGNPFRSVTTFIVKGSKLTLLPDSKRMSGIECEITYVRE